MSSSGLSEEIDLDKLRHEIKRAQEISIASLELAKAERKLANMYLDIGRVVAEVAQQRGQLWELRINHYGPKKALGALSSQELVVAQLLADTQLSATEIARKLYLSVNTIKTHQKNIYRKLGISRRQDVVAAYKRLINQADDMERNGDSEGTDTLRCSAGMCDGCPLCEFSTLSDRS